MDKIELLRVVQEHASWLSCVGRGKRADLQGADLRDAELVGADLRLSNLDFANLVGAGLRYANLAFAKLRGAGLRGADLRGANLRDTKLVALIFSMPIFVTSWRGLICGALICVMPI